MMLNFPITDTHVHLWDPTRLRYEWLDGILALNRPFLLADFDRLSAPIAVEKMVFVQCDCIMSQLAEEVAWVSQMAEHDARVAGIVAGAPLENGDAVQADLAALASNPKVKGVRRILQAESAEFCLQPSFIAGVQRLAQYDLTFDICIHHRQLANVIKLVAQSPNVTFVLDHIGKPDIESQLFEPWRADLRQLAHYPNVWCKLSGLVTEADHEGWKSADLQPYIEHTIDCFGFDRVMYGGDWPVSTLATTYPRWVETLAQAVQGCSDDEQHNLFRNNAHAFYRLT